MTSTLYTLSEVIEFGDTTDNVFGEAVISGRTIAIYAEFKVIGDVSDTIGTIKENYRPKNRYAIFPVYTKTKPYNPQNASIWAQDGGNLRAYGITVGSSYYVYCSWIF